MTIVDKWRLMMSSFADIKAAIIEKGGTVPDGKGYNRYANAVRQIYSDTYTDEYQYPEKVHIIISYVADLVRWCKAIKEQIRLAIVDGGVECSTDVPLSQYGNKIRQIQVFEIATTALPEAEYSIPYTAQLEAKGGTPPYTWEYIGYGPVGMKISEDGIVAFTPSTTGSYSHVMVRCTDSSGKILKKPLNIIVWPRTVHVELVGDSEFTYDGEPHILTFRCIEVPELEIGASCSDKINAGTRLVSPFSKKGQYMVESDRDYYMTIRPLSITITHTSPQIYTFDGEQHAYEYIGSPEYVPIVKYKPYSNSDNLITPRKDSGYTDTPPSEVGKYRVWFSAADLNHIISDGSGQSWWYVFGVLEIKEADNV